MAGRERSAAFIIMSLLLGISVHRLNRTSMEPAAVQAEIERMLAQWFFLRGN